MPPMEAASVIWFAAATAVSNPSLQRTTMSDVILERWLPLKIK